MDLLETLKFVNQYDAVTIPQVGAYFGYSSYTTLTEKLDRLSWPREEDLPFEKKARNREIRKRILEKRWIPHPTRLRGGPSLIYILGSTGQDKIEEAWIEVKRRDFGHGTVISEDNWHNINCNWPHIVAHLWAKKTLGVRVLEDRARTAFDFDRDRKLRELCKKLGIGKGGRIMDGLQAFAFDDPDKDDKQFLLEVETGSNEPAAIRKKVEGLVNFEKHFPEVFGNNIFNGYLFFATATYGLKQNQPRYENSEEHRKMLLREIAIQLGKMGLRREFGPLFRVTSELPNSPHLFDRPVWWFPDDYSGPYRLFVDRT